MIVAITGRSTSGKTFIATHLPQMEFVNLVSHTTRLKRKGEMEGFDYHYVSEEEFIAMSHKASFVETTHFCDAFYGLSRDELNSALQSGQSLVHVCSPSGVRALEQVAQKMGYSFVSVFVCADDKTFVFRTVKRWMLDRHLSVEYLADRLVHGLVIEYQWSGHFNHVLPTSNGFPDLIVDLRAYRSGEKPIPAPSQKKAQLRPVPHNTLYQDILAVLKRAGRPNSKQACDALSNQVLSILEKHLEAL